MKLKYLIQTKEDFEAVVEYLTEEPIIGIDTETNGKWSRYELSLVGISLGFDLFSVYIPLTHFEGDQLDLPYVLEALRPFLEDPKNRYVFHNAKFDEKVFKIYGIDCKGSGDCTFVMAWMLSEEGSHGLKPSVLRYLRVQMTTYEDVIQKRPRRRGEAIDYNFAGVSLTDALEYAADDAYYTVHLYHIFMAKLKQQALDTAYTQIERPLIRVVKGMELSGIHVDEKYMRHAQERLPLIMDQIASEIYEEVGVSFNLDSGQQLGRILFEVLNIGNNVPKTPKGQYKTDKKTLELYAPGHEIVSKILRRKTIKKTYDVFVEGLFTHVHNQKVHCNFNAQGTVSGRFSSSKPNMQQLQGDEIEEIRVRDFFVPAPGNVFVVGDFGQIELRVMAHFARDSVAIAAFNSGRDFHSETARAMFSLGESVEPTTRQRFYAKALNFGIPYGRGPTSVGEVLGIKPWCRSRDCGECASCFIGKWYEGFPSVGPFKEKFLSESRRMGYMRTIAGRKRRLPNLRSHDNMLRSAAERQAFNTLCQGSAADIIKLGMVQAEPKLRELSAQVLLTIHDELLTEVPVNHAEETVEVLHSVMESPLNGRNPLVLPLKFEPKIVERWSQAK